MVSIKISFLDNLKKYSTFLQEVEQKKHIQQFFVIKHYKTFMFSKAIKFLFQALSLFSLNYLYYTFI